VKETTTDPQLYDATEPHTAKTPLDKPEGDVVDIYLYKR
jgi:hypothetical protein